MASVDFFHSKIDNDTSHTYNKRLRILILFIHYTDVFFSSPFAKL